MNELNAPHDKLFDEVHTLIVASTERALTDDEHARLEQLVCDNAAARKIYVRHMLQTASLRSWAGGEESSVISGQSSEEEQPAVSDQPSASADASSLVPRSKKSWLDRAAKRPVKPALAVAALVMISVVAWMGVTTVKTQIAGGGNKSTDEQQEPTKPEFVAWLMKAHETQWLDDTEPQKTKLMPGQRLAIAKGLIEIQYRTRAVVVIEGPAVFYVGSQESEGRSQEKDANSGYLALGKLVARVEGEDAKGFTVNTPTGSVEDVSTEFAVAVSPAGVTDALCYDGKVVARIRQPGAADVDAAGRELLAGDALRLERRADGRVAFASAPSRVGRSFVRYSEFRRMTTSHLIRPVAVTASSEFNNGLGLHLPATNLIDGSGLSDESASALHRANSLAKGMWHTGHRTPEDARVTRENGLRATGPGLVADEELVFDLGGSYDLQAAQFWEINQDARGHGVKTFEIWVSNNPAGDDFSLVPGGPWTLKQNHKGRGLVGAEHVRFRAENVRRVKIDILTTHADKNVGHAGLSEVRFWGVSTVDEFP